MAKPASRRRIALFGSSFNPPHLGHVAVLKDLAAQNLFDEIWLLPVYSHAFAKELAPFAARLDMLELLREDLGDPRVKICRIEAELKKSPSYTFDTVTELRRRHPDADFFMIAGSDVKKELHKWHRAEELKTILDFHFIPRPGHEASPYPPVSSTEIRERLKKGQIISDLTTARIAEYLARNGIYRTA